MKRMYCDGGIVFNPDRKTGQIGYAYVLKNEENNIISKEAGYLKEGTTPIAEYLAIKLGLQNAVKENVKEIIVCSDSKLVINQINKIFSVYNPVLKGLFFDIQQLRSNFTNISFKWIPREENEEADSLCAEKLKPYRRKNAIITN